MGEFKAKADCVRRVSIDTVEGKANEPRQYGAFKMSGGQWYNFWRFYGC